jgi:hypothetical protein
MKVRRVLVGLSVAAAGVLTPIAAIAGFGFHDPIGQGTSANRVQLDVVRAEATPSADDNSVRELEPGDDRGRRHAEPGDDRGRGLEPGDDRGVRELEAGDDRSGDEAEPGDDRGALEDESGDDNSGHGSESGHDHGGR